MPTLKRIGGQLVEVPDELAKVPESDLEAAMATFRRMQAKTDNDPKTGAGEAGADIDLGSEDIEAQYRMELAGNELLRDPQEAAQREMEATIGTIASAPSRFASGVATELGSAALGMVNPLSWWNAVKGVAERFGMAWDEAKQGDEAARRGDILGAWTHGARSGWNLLNTVAPIEPVYTRLRDQYHEGDTAGTLGSAAGIAGSVFLPGPTKMAKAALKVGGEALSHVPLVSRGATDPTLWERGAQRQIRNALSPDLPASVRLSQAPSTELAQQLMLDIVKDQRLHRNWTRGGPLDQALKRLDDIKSQHQALEAKLDNVPVPIDDAIAAIEARVKPSLRASFRERIRDPQGRFAGVQWVHSPASREYAAAIQEYIDDFLKRRVKATKKPYLTVGEIRSEIKRLNEELRSTRLRASKHERSFRPTTAQDDLAMRQIREGLKDAMYDVAPALRESDAAVAAASSLVDLLVEIRKAAIKQDTAGVRAAATMMGSHLPAAATAKRAVAVMSMAGAPTLYHILRYPVLSYKLAQIMSSMADAVRRGDTALAWADLHHLSALLRNPTKPSRWTVVQHLREQGSRETRFEDQEDQE
jgi:hypothetical protein